MSGSEVERFDLKWCAVNRVWECRSEPSFSLCAAALDKHFDLPRGAVTVCVSRREVRCPDVAVLETYQGVRAGGTYDLLDGKIVLLSYSALVALRSNGSPQKFWVWFEYEE